MPTSSKRQHERLTVSLPYGYSRAIKRLATELNLSQSDLPLSWCSGCLSPYWIQYYISACFGRYTLKARNVKMKDLTPSLPLQRCRRDGSLAQASCPHVLLETMAQDAPPHRRTDKTRKVLKAFPETGCCPMHLKFLELSLSPFINGFPDKKIQFSCL